MHYLAMTFFKGGVKFEFERATYMCTYGWCAALIGNGGKGGGVGECCPLPPASPPPINETLTIDTTCALSNDIIFDIGSLEFFSQLRL